ncbi:MAG: SelT/SelW/SelH family protein [Tissierellia bacterium]|nr:SelT/SelW/SelH family protein [Tissierellia bacterium]
MRSILNEHKNNISEAKLIPSSGGVFEVSLNDELIFSKKNLDRYPEKGEVEEIIRNKLL